MAESTKDDVKSSGAKYEDRFPFPLLTRDISDRLGGGQGPGEGGGSAGTVVESVVRQVLGWRPKSGDSKGFVAALTQSFKIVEVEGRTETAWAPRGVSVQADLGAVTGAQASIYFKAKVFLEQSLPLLDGLTGLGFDDDEQDMEATRSMVRSALVELVNELGVEGGPKEHRVDTHFVTLTGFDPEVDVPPFGPEDVGGQLGLLRDRFGLKREFVNTVTEEQTYTNFIILVSYVDGLIRSWKAQRDEPDQFLGTQLVLLSRALAVVAESVEELQFVLDSVFIGPNEREVAPLQGISPRMTIAELLGWIERFASDEGPRLIQDGGKDGVLFAFLPTIRKLRDLVSRGFGVTPAPAPGAGGSGVLAVSPTALDPALCAPDDVLCVARVRIAVEQLVRQLNYVVSLGDKLQRLPEPEIEDVVIDGMAGALSGGGPGGVRFVIVGSGFRDGVKVALGATESTGTLAHPAKVVNETLIYAYFNADVAKAGKAVLTVTNFDGQRAKADLDIPASSISGPTPRPTPIVIDAVLPGGSILPDQSTNLTIFGTGFGTKVHVKPVPEGHKKDVKVEAFHLHDDKTLIVTVHAPEPGEFQLEVINQDTGETERTPKIRVKG